MMGPGLDERTPLLSDLTPSSTSQHPRWAGRGCCGPDGWLTRVTALLLMSFVGFGAFFCFDNPGALQSEVRTVFDIDVHIDIDIDIELKLCSTDKVGPEPDDLAVLLALLLLLLAEPRPPSHRRIPDRLRVWSPVGNHHLLCLHPAGSDPAGSGSSQQLSLVHGDGSLLFRSGR